MSMVVELWTPGVRYVGFTKGFSPPSLFTQNPSVQVLGGAQGMPHPPQLFGSLSVFVQPVGSGQQVSPVEHAGPVLHVIEGVHLLETHVSPSGQTLPHLPQSLLSLVVSSQPSPQHCKVPLHAGPPLHVMGDWQKPDEHVLSGPHARPHVPQLFGSLSVLVHPDGQHVSPSVQAAPSLHPTGGVQLPFWHIEPGPQAWLHMPQLSGSVCVSVQPSMQQVCPPVHAGSPLHDAPILHWLSTQVSPGEHAKPHFPQLLGSLEVSTQPLPQQTSGGMQAGPPLQVVGVWHAPATHVAVGAQ